MGRPRVRFNEAAGIPRGRPNGNDYDEERNYASMRPRVFPAEDTGVWNPTRIGIWLQ